MIKKIFRKYFLLILLSFFSLAINKVYVYAKPLVIKVRYMVNNDCYKYGRKIHPIGIMVHSTATPGVMGNEWFVLWNKSYKDGENEEKGKEVCVHAFVDDKAAYQYLPWDQRAWHCGRAKLGGLSANDTHISFEICEPESIKYDAENNKIIEYDPNDMKNQKYFNDIWENSVCLCANLCQKFEINPEEIISHQEGHSLGIASNHGDPKHWWDFHKKDMNEFRADVFRELMRRLFQVILQDSYAREYFLGYPLTSFKNSSVFCDH